jgi:hypothetical protein
MEKYNKPQLTNEEINNIADFIKAHPFCSQREIEDNFPNAAKWRVLKIKTKFNLPKRYSKPAFSQKEFAKLGMRRCPQCETVKPLSEYYSNNISRCIPCERLRCIPKFKRQQIKDYSCVENLLKVRIKEIYNSGKYRKCKEIPTVTHAELLEIFHKQQGLCFYTKRPLGFIPNDIHTLSVDRKDSSSGYHAGNIVLCIFGINKMKNDLPLNVFHQLCKEASINLDDVIERDGDT